MKLFEKEYLCNQNNAKSKDAAKRNRSPNLSNEFETIEARAHLPFLNVTEHSRT